MPSQAKSFSPSAIAALAASLSVFALFTSSGAAGAAETCLAAPKSPPPQGSHWYYRTDRSLQRKCWYLAGQDRKAPGAAVRAEAQPKSGKELDAPAPARNAADRSQPDLQRAPEWITRNASESAQAAAPVLQPDPPGNTIAREESPTPAPPEPDKRDGQDRSAIVEPPVQQPIVAAEGAATVPDAAGLRPLQLAFAAVAILGFLACAVFYVVDIRRRRADVLSTALDVTMPPVEVPAARDEVTFAPLPPMEPIARRNDVDEALQRFRQTWKQRAA